MNDGLRENGVDMFGRVAGIVGLWVLFAVGSAFAQSDAPSQDWSEARFGARFEAFDWLIGEWQGYGQFEDRTTYIHKRYSYDVAGVYLVERTLDVFPPQEVSTDFEVHQDFSVFYRNNQTGDFALNGFFVETFVTQAAVGVAQDGSSFVVESTSIYNGPPEMRTRMTYTRSGTDEFRLRFEIAPPGQEYRVAEEAVFKRIQ